MPSPNYTPRIWVNLAAPALSAANLNAMETGIEDAHERLDALTAQLPRITVGNFALLTGLVNGVEYLLEVDDPRRAGSKLLWHVKYDSAEASLYKWQVVSAVPLVARAAGPHDVTADTFSQLGTIALSLPRAGDYDFGIAAWARAAAGNTDVVSLLAPKPNGQAASDAEALETDQLNSYDPSFSTRPAWSGSTRAPRLGCASGSCQLHGRNTNAAKTVTYQKIVFEAHPIRIRHDA